MTEYSSVYFETFELISAEICSTAITFRKYSEETLFKIENLFLTPGW
jgi:hypothetical protein